MSEDKKVLVLTTLLFTGVFCYCWRSIFILVMFILLWLTCLLVYINWRKYYKEQKRKETIERMLIKTGLKKLARSIKWLEAKEGETAFEMVLNANPPTGSLEDFKTVLNQNIKTPVEYLDWYCNGTMEQPLQRILFCDDSKLCGYVEGKYYIYKAIAYSPRKLKKDYDNYFVRNKNMQELLAPKKFVYGYGKLLRFQGGRRYYENYRVIIELKGHPPLYTEFKVDKYEVEKYPKLLALEDQDNIEKSRLEEREKEIEAQKNKKLKM